MSTGEFPAAESRRFIFFHPEKMSAVTLELPAVRFSAVNFPLLVIYVPENSGQK
jgi:hypothetical protein